MSRVSDETVGGECGKGGATPEPHATSGHHLPRSESVAPAQAAANGAARPVKAKPEPRPKRATAAKSAKAAPSRTEAA